MNMLKPVNNHLLIKPVKHETFVQSQRETYEEIGTVLDFDPLITHALLAVGCKVYFDAWLAGKYPSEVDDEFYWLVNFDDVKAIEHEPIPE